MKDDVQNRAIYASNQCIKLGAALLFRVNRTPASQPANVNRVVQNDILKQMAAYRLMAKAAAMKASS